MFRRRNPNDSIDDGQSSATPVTDPHEQRLWYRDIQRGGEVPLHGLRKPQPDRPIGNSQKIFFFGAARQLCCVCIRIYYLEFEL